MTAQPGLNIFILDGTGTAATAIAALRTTTLKIGNKPIDTTNRDSGGWQELLSGGGMTSIQVQGDGVITDGTIFATLGSRAIDRTAHLYTVDFGNALTKAGNFIITSFEAAGVFDKEQTYKLALDSSGTIA
jgi:TP901-1 family phage major tail protein